MNLHFGFSGAERGVTLAQAKTVDELFYGCFNAAGQLITLHHGDCIGADAYADEKAYGYGFAIETHPCGIVTKRAFCHVVRPSTRRRVHPVQRPLVRNRVIVASSLVLVATPERDEEVLRSGTWATIRHARATAKPVIHVKLNGDVSIGDGDPTPLLSILRRVIS